MSFEGAGCANLEGLGLDDDRRPQAAPWRKPTRCFRALHTNGDDAAGPAGRDMGKLSSLAGVREFPVRVKCASLAWHTLKPPCADATRVDGIGRRQKQKE